MTPIPSDMIPTDVLLMARQSVEYQQEHLYQDYTRNLGGYIIVLVFLSFASMVARIWCRIRQKESLAADDWTYIVGTWLAIGSFIVMLLYAFNAGLGKHWVALTPDQQLLFPKLNYAYNILNVVSYPLVKISILLLYIRVFFVLKTFCKIIWVGIAVIAASGLANALVSIFSCLPVEGFFNMAVPSKCIDSVDFYYWTAAFNCATDFFILIAPMPVIWKRNISHKVAISMLFLLGGLTFVVSILRIVYYLEYSTSDPSYSFLDSGYATPGEVCLATVVAAAPTWGRIWKKSGSGLRSLYSGIVHRSRGSRSLDSGHTARDEQSPAHAHSPEKQSRTTVATVERNSESNVGRLGTAT